MRRNYDHKLSFTYIILYTTVLEVGKKYLIKKKIPLYINSM